MANSLAAVRAGARQIQGTLNGLGERCGNANLVSLIGNLKLKPGLFRAFRDRRRRRQARKPHPRRPRPRRDPQPRARPPCALCGRERVRDQGRHPRLGDHEGPGDLRACEAGGGRQPAQAPGVGPGGALERARRIGAHRHRRGQGRSARLSAARRRQGARGGRLCLRGGRRLLRIAGAAHAGEGARLFRRHPVRRQCRAAHQRQRRARHASASPSSR